MESTGRKISFKNILFAVFSLLIIAFAIHRFSSKSDNGDELMPYEEITHLAQKHQLDDISGVNQHLSFTKGDYHYWADRKLPRKELRIQFNARKRILDLAKKEQRKIETQEDLAAEVEILIIKDIADKYDLNIPKGYNPHLVLDKGDFSYWKNTNLSLEEIEERFKIMSKLLENAEKDKTLIQTKSELGYLVEQNLKKNK